MPEAPPTDVFGALVKHVRDGLGFEVTLDREPEQTSARTRKLPYVIVEGDFDTDWNFEQALVDAGDVTMTVFAVGDTLAAQMATAIKRLFRSPSDWPSIVILGAKFIEVSQKGYGLHPEDEPDKDGNIVYRYNVNFHVELQYSL